MGHKTKKIFLVGGFIVICFILIKPTIIFVFGSETKGEVVNTDQYSYFKGKYRGNKAFQYPIVEFKLDGKAYRFKGNYNPNGDCQIKEIVSIKYISSFPSFAEINSFENMFLFKILIVLLFLFVWIAFWLSFPKLLDK